MMKNRVLFLVFTVVCSVMFPQGKGLENTTYEMPNTEIKYLKSNSNGINYKLYFSYPKSYNDSISKKYPVLYLLDADYSFAIAKNIIDHLSERNHIKEIIIVGIAYPDSNNYRLNRTRDYTPTNSIESGVTFQEIQKQYSGGGKKFSSFIEKELIPFVDKNLRTTNFRAITGHSYGGLFSTWTLLTKPHLFNGYIIVSPSLWYDNHLMFKIEKEFDYNDANDIKAYFTVGDREINQNWNMPKDLTDFVMKLKEKNLKNIEIKIEEDETHNSIFPVGFSKGLRYVFDGI